MIAVCVITCMFSVKKCDGKYNFTQGSWEKKLIERVHNVAKAGRKRSTTSAVPPAKRGRPKSDNPILKRYPPLRMTEEIDENDVQALQVELAKDKPRKDVVLPLIKNTFAERRQYVLSTQVSIADVTERYKSFLLPYAVGYYTDSQHILLNYGLIPCV